MTANKQSQPTTKTSRQQQQPGSISQGGPSDDLRPFAIKKELYEVSNQQLLDSTGVLVSNKRKLATFKADSNTNTNNNNNNNSINVSTAVDYANLSRISNSSEMTKGRKIESGGGECEQASEESTSTGAKVMRRDDALSTLNRSITAGDEQECEPSERESTRGQTTALHDKDDILQDKEEQNSKRKNQDDEINNNEDQHQTGYVAGDSSQQLDKQQQEQDKQLTNLIVNYLPQSMSQEEIRTLFSSIGEVESCKLIRDKSTINQSLGYGFVNYVRPEDAQRAIKSFNGLRLQNKTIKVSYARPSSESIKGANLYVSGLPKSMTQLELEQLFKPYGKIITSRILCDNLTGISKGVGFVRFDQRFEAEKAIEALNNTYIQVQDNSVNVSRQPPSSLAQVSQDSTGQTSQIASTTATTSAATTGGTSDTDVQHESHTTTATPIIVKFANSPSSNPQKQFSAVSAAPSSAHHHLLAASLHQPMGPTSTSGLGAYLGVTSSSLHQSHLAGSARSTGSSRFSATSSDTNPTTASQQAIFHYPSNRFRYTPMSELAALASHHSGAFLNPFATVASHQHQHQQQQGSSSGITDSSSAAAAVAAFANAAAAAAAAASGHMLPGYFETSGSSASSSIQSARLRGFPQASILAGAGGLQANPSAASTAIGATSASGVGPISTPLDQHAQRLAAASGHSSGWCLFVYNLAPEVEENVIWKLFGPFGAIQQVNLVKDGQTNKCKGFAFVTMTDYNQALMAIQSLNGYTLANRVLQVSFKTNKVRKTMAQ